jgi:hypothetical protein
MLKIYCIGYKIIRFSNGIMQIIIWKYNIMDKKKYSLYLLIIGNLIGYNDFYNNNPLD